MRDRLATDHLSESELMLLLHGTDHESTLLAAEDHLEVCDDCRQRLELLAGDEPDWRATAAALLDEDGCDELNSFGIEPFAANPYSGLPPTSETLSGAADSESARSRQLLAMVRPLLTASDDPRMLGRLGRFEIAGVVGSGGMGVVLKAVDPALARYVAVKILAPHLSASPTARRRFAREARAAAAVLHDNVIAIYQVEPEADPPYLVMPYLPGPSLQQRIAESGPLNRESSLSLALQIAHGLAAAHHQGLVHRDVKPANVLLASGTDRAIITDFGLARASDDASLTREGTVAGTPHYMSPEQARGDSVDSRSDVFSLGSVLFAMLTGQPPVPFETGSETLREIAAGNLPRLTEVQPEAPDWLDRLIDSLHQIDPDNRLSIDDAVQTLQQCLAHEREPNRHTLPTWLTRNGGPRHRITRQRLSHWAIATCLGLVVAATTWWIAGLSSAPPRLEHPRSHEARDADTHLQPNEKTESTTTGSVAQDRTPSNESEAFEEEATASEARAASTLSNDLLEQIDRELSVTEAELQRLEKELAR